MKKHEARGLINSTFGFRNSQLEKAMPNEIQVDYNSGQTLYAVIRDSTGRVWCPAGQDFETWGDDSHAAGDYCLPLADSGGSHYVGSLDESVPGGSYSIQVFRQTGTTPADTDVLVSSRQILWTGIGELTAAKILANRAAQDKVTGRIDYYDDDNQTVLLSLTPVETLASIQRLRIAD
jgi:hypothetical protein